jgi:muramoyltetrapeptide carboxypeptidase
VKPASLFYPLVPNDLIEIIAPGSSAPAESLHRGSEFLRGWGFQVHSDENILKPELYLANSDKYRFEALKKAILDPKVKAIWCFRGGYGALRLLPPLEKIKAPKQKKLLIGFSDVTSLHMFLNNKWNWPSLHGPLASSLGTEKFSDSNLKELQAALMNPEHVTDFANLTPMNAAAQKKKKIEAPVIGGNLMVLNSSLGTPWQVRTKGKILFLEEVGERGYRIDRMLHQFLQAGIFRDAKAVVLGDFIKGGESDGKDHVPVTLENFFRELKIPVFKGLQAGHDEIQRPLFFNTRTVLTCGSVGRMLNYGPK